MLLCLVCLMEFLDCFWWLLGCCQAATLVLLMGLLGCLCCVLCGLYGVARLFLLCYV